MRHENDGEIGPDEDLMPMLVKRKMRLINAHTFGQDCGAILLEASGHATGPLHGLHASAA